MAKQSVTDENTIESDVTVNEAQTDLQEHDLGQEEITPSRKKRIGFWGWLLVLITLIVGAIALAFPRLDQNSEIYKRVTSVPYVGDRVAAWSGGSSSYQGAQSETQDQASSNADETSEANGTEAQIETAQSEVAVAGQALENDVDAAVKEATDQAEATAKADEAAGDAQENANGSEDGDQADAGEGENVEGAAGVKASNDADELKSENEELKLKVEKLEEELESAKSGQETAKSTQAVSNLQMAAISGMSLEGAVAEAEAQGVAVPVEVKAQMSGVPTAVELQNEFGPYATQALRASKVAESGDGIIAGIVGRFKAEYVSRSLTPQEGATPDAVLSRAEDSLRNGNLEQSLSDIATLPSEAQDAMQPWVERANTRLDVLTSIEKMLQENQSN